ncbi:TPA: hypothetical protein MIV92_002364, partial [Clostridioides difficile]|nr:hypothetical protein [Clostridioides difficile]
MFKIESYISNSLNKKEGDKLLNEDVVKKLKNVPNNTNTEIEKVNTNIETAKTELNTKIDQLIAGGSNVASTQTITI